jgi:DNA-binding response OmpR family regulator
VEDEALLRGLIAQFLRTEGYEVVECRDGGEGIERFASEGTFDLVLLDLDLPVSPGVEVCRRIRWIRPDQAVIICSAAILDGHIAALSALGVDQFLSKPYHPGELLSRIAIELDRAAPGASALPSAHEPAGTWRVDAGHARPPSTHALAKKPVID